MYAHNRPVDCAVFSTFYGMAILRNLQDDAILPARDSPRMSGKN